MLEETYIRKATVTRVVDGDTLVCDIDLGFGIWRIGQKLRVLGINCPELHGATHVAGKAAMDATAAWFGDLPANVTIQTFVADTDAFGRVLAKVERSDGADLGDYLLSKGFAVYFKE